MKFQVCTNPKEISRCPIKDEQGNTVRTYLFVDWERVKLPLSIWQINKTFSQQPNTITLAPGDFIDLEPRVPGGPTSDSEILQRAGAICTPDKYRPTPAPPYDPRSRSITPDGQGLTFTE